MKSFLTDPWFEAGFRFVTDGHSRHVDSLEEANAVFLYCPCSFGKSKGAHGLLIPIANANVNVSPMPGGKAWNASGTGLGDLTLTPSLNIGSASGDPCWHGHVRQGELVSV